jgi:hypothetical protein
MPQNKLLLLTCGGIVAAAMVTAAAWWLLSPLFIDQTVQEDFPFALDATVPPDMSRAEVEQIMAGMARVNTEAVQDSMDDLMLQATGSEATDAARLAVLKTGRFRDADAVHRGSGVATVYQGPDGARVLRLEDFNSTNGPDLHVILSPTADPGSRDEVNAPGYVNLGKLKGNVGDQNYAIPGDTEIPARGSIVIYCRAFHVIFSVATLEDPGQAGLS